MQLLRLLAIAIALCTALFSGLCRAEQVSFRVALEPDALVLAPTGDATAYFPQVFALDAFGNWMRVQTRAEKKDLAGAGRLRFELPDRQRWHPAQALCITYQDKAGVRFQQFAFLQAMQPASGGVLVEWVNGSIRLARQDNAIQRTLVLNGGHDALALLDGRSGLPQSPLPPGSVVWNTGGKAHEQHRLVTPPGDIVLLHERMQSGTTTYSLERFPAPAASSFFLQPPRWLKWHRWYAVLAIVVLAFGLTIAWKRRSMPVPGICLQDPAGQRQDWPGQLASSLLDGSVALLFAALTVTLLQPALLNSPALPTGGDTASHLLYAWTFVHEVWPRGELTSWMPEVFGGFPLLSYYFPLPFIATVWLEPFLGFAPAFKWAMVLPLLCLPGAVFMISRHALGFHAVAAFCGALGSFAFLTHEQNSIWGGNILSMLAGEFAYGWGMLFTVVTLALWLRAARSGSGWILAAVFEAMTGLCHGYALLMTGFGSGFLLIDGRHRSRTFLLLLKGHLLAFILLGGWLWPLLEMHGFTIPNDGVTHITSWLELLPATLWPVYGAATMAVLSAVHPSLRAFLSGMRLHAVLFFGAVAVLACCAWLGADRLGLADLRFFPFAWLFAAIASGWLTGSIVLRLTGQGSKWIALSLLAGLLAWIAPLITRAPEWAQWNFSGLAAKPQWQVFTGMFPDLSGSMMSPRLLFEHDPANIDLGSTRTLEALPMFTGGRPVLEGLYMESAILGPVVYQLQSEVSASPSSPLTRFPSGRLDAEMAARHMQILHTNDVLVRSETARQALVASGLFEPVTQHGPFNLLRLRGFQHQLVDASPRNWTVKSKDSWMVDSYRWFRSRKRLAEEWPVYALAPSRVEGFFTTVQQKPVIESLRMTRKTITFTTSAPKQAHLIKIAFHPRWKLESKGELLMAAPGYLLVVPQEREVRLSYGMTTVGNAGRIASMSGVLFLIGWAAWRMRRRNDPGMGAARLEKLDARDQAPTMPGWILAMVVAGAGGAWLHLSSAERLYQRAWDAMNINSYREAGDLFLEAQAKRRAPAAQEEALFWAAKAREQAGDLKQAVDLYAHLSTTYTGYWAPESLYNEMQIWRALGNDVEAKIARTKLLNDYPTDRWAQRASQESAGRD